MNWNMLGHEWAVTHLKEQIARGNARHAYLFIGPQGVGRRTLALRLAQALNCVQPLAPGEPCLTCRACQKINKMQHPDLAVVQAEQMGETLKVDQIRELQRSLSLTPYEARYRVAILMRFEEANPNASNALLKTLEEPPPQVILMITAESNERLLPTIVSRCEVLRLRPLLPEAVNLGLQHHWDLPPEEAFLLAHISGGRPGYALKLHNEPALLQQRQAWLNEHQHMLAANRVDRFTYAERLAKDKDGLRRALQVWLSLWRDVLLKATGTSTTLINVDRIEDIEKLSTHLSVQVAYNMVISLERTIKQLNQNVNPRLASEVLLLDLPSIQ